MQLCFSGESSCLRHSTGSIPMGEHVRLQNQARRKSYSRGENVVRSAIKGLRNLTNIVIRRDKHVSLGYRYFRQGWIVDLGCGLENFGPLPPSCKLLGIEISNRIVADARPIFESRGGRIIHADVLSGLQSLEAASCDGALVESYLEHEVQPAEVLRELSRVLPGARLSSSCRTTLAGIDGCEERSGVDSGFPTM